MSHWSKVKFSRIEIGKEEGEGNLKRREGLGEVMKAGKLRTCPSNEQ